MNSSLIPLLLNTIAAVPTPDKSSGIDLIVILVTLFTGLAIIIVVLIKYFKDEDIGKAGIILVIIGFLLMTVSIYKTIEIIIRKDRIDVKLEKLLEATKQLQKYFEPQKKLEREKEAQPNDLKRY